MTEPAVVPEPAAEPAPPPAPAPAPEPLPTSWRDGLEADMRDNPALAKYDDVPALAKGFLEGQTLIGKKGIIPPGEGASDEDMARFYGELGRPETVEGYDLGEFQPPESIAEFWDSQGMDEMAGEMYDLGLTKAQATGLLSKFADHQAARMGDTLTAIKTGKSEAGEALKGEWGLAYPGKIDLAKRAMASVAEWAGVSQEELAGTYLPDGGLVGNSPLLTKVFAELGEHAGELKFLGGSKSQRTTLTPDEADGEIAKLEAHEAFNDSRHAEHKQIIAKRDALYKQKYPGEEG